MFVLSACSSDQLEYSTSDAKHHDLIVRLLDKNNIPYELENGTIKYSVLEKDQIEQALQKVRKTTTLKFEQETVREYFYSLLEQRDIHYLRANEGSDGEVIFWPSSEDEVTEVLEKTIEYRFEQEIKNGKFDK